MMAQKSVAAQQFSFNLGAAGPKLLVGGTDASAFSGALEWHNLVSKSYWVVSAKAKVGSTVASGNFNAIIDTGTTVIVAPTKDAAAFWKKVSGAKAYGGGFYSYPCSSKPSVSPPPLRDLQVLALTPDDQVSFNFGGSDWTLSDDTLNLGGTGKSNQCLGAIMCVSVVRVSWSRADRRSVHTAARTLASTRGSWAAASSRTSTRRSTWGPLASASPAQSEETRSLVESEFSSPGVRRRTPSPPLPIPPLSNARSSTLT